MKKLFVSYARISDLSGKRRTELENRGIANQQYVCRILAKRCGGEVVREYADNDRSASRSEHRPGFEALLRELYQHRPYNDQAIDGVITVDKDRVYKTPAQWERFLAAFRAAPGRLFVTEAALIDLYTLETEEDAHASLTVSAGENQKRSGRIRRWHEAQARQGIPHTGGRTFGYRPVADAPGTIEIVPEHAAVIRDAVAACVAGRSWGEIVSIFSSSGLPTEKGGPWRVQTVKQIISSPRLAGLRLLNGELVVDESGRPVVGQRDPIISQDEWQAVRARYEPRLRLPDGRAKNPEPPTPRKYILSGLLRCGKEIGGRTCGTVMLCGATKVGKSEYRYACRATSDGGCSGTAVSGEWMEAQILDLVVSRFETGYPRLPAQPHWPGQAELDALLARRDNLESSWQRGLISDDVFTRNSTAIEELLTVRKAEHRSWTAVQAIHSHDADEIRIRWPLPVDEGGYDFDQKRALISSQLSAVFVYPVGKGNKNRDKDSYRAVFTEAASAGA